MFQLSQAAKRTINRKKSTALFMRVPADAIGGSQQKELYPDVYRHDCETKWK
jgi:hypothetical protein